jgi:Family of unknown function (DUF5995)
MSAQPARETGPAKTIDEVVSHLDEIIARSRREDSRFGYFATLYRNVTVEVKRGIEAGRFEDGARMERLDVNFANRYLRALDCYRRGEPASRCWITSFKAVSKWPPIVLQHLLMGMNAHINLDLGVAAAITCPGDQLLSLKHDFDEINNILSAMIEGVQMQLGQISRWMVILEKVGGKTERAVMNWSIDRARDAAWSVAERFAPLGPEQMDAAIKKLDGEVDLLGLLIRHPGRLISAGNFVVRLSEPRNVGRIIEILA